MGMSVRVVALATVVSLLSIVEIAAAQEGPNYEQLRKQHDDAQRELRAAQERKNQLSAENEDLRRQITAARAELEELRRTDAEHAERSYHLRAHHMAWKAFTGGRPDLLAQWRAYLQNDVLLAPTDPADVIDPDWPISHWRPAPRERLPATPATLPVTEPAATAPASVPATAPAVTTSGPTTVPVTHTAVPTTSPATQPATLPG